MSALVLESKLGSQYEDTPGSYEFPSRYLTFFQPGVDEPLFAVLYEPRGDGSGSMCYFAWTEILGRPYPSGRSTPNGQALWRVDYRGPATLFGEPVPREVSGIPLEGWLRQIPRGRLRNSATIGRAVRPLNDVDFQAIMRLGNSASLTGMDYPEAGEHAASTDAAVKERSRRIVEIISRSAVFSRSVLAAYGYRCAISGFDLGQVARTRTAGLVDAAHIRPVARSGSDSVSNGLALTPTLHRLFDAGYFTLDHRGSRVTIEVSPLLERSMVEVPDRGFALPLVSGLEVRLPLDTVRWPSREQVRFHRREVFLDH